MHNSVSFVDAVLWAAAFTIVAVAEAMLGQECYRSQINKQLTHVFNTNVGTCV